MRCLIIIQDIPESYEDYLKAIYLISKNNKGGWVSNKKISDFLRVRPASVSNMLHKLRERGYINWSPRSSLRLTENGKKKALAIVHYYNQLYEFFINVLNVKDKRIIQEACCKIEHLMTPEVSTSLDNFLENDIDNKNKIST